MGEYDCMRTKPRRPILLALILLFSVSSLGFIISPVHASTYVGFGAAQASAAACSGTLCEPAVADAASGNGFGEIVQAPFAGTLVAAGVFTGNGVPNQIVILSFPAGTTPAVSAYPNGFCNGTCYTTNTGQTFTVVDVENVAGMNSLSFNTVTLANPPTTIIGQWFAIVWMLTSGGSQYLMSACGGISATCSQFGSTVAAIGFTFGSTNPSGTFSSKCLPNSCGGPFVEGPITTGASFNPSGSVNSLATQCYGNCGTPPITLANTNSTHTINFNQSITLFYEFQSNINGFVLNITTNVAKTYTPPSPSNFGQSLAFYAIPNGCPIGQIPFTPACPGFKQFGSFTPSQTVKGLYSQAVTNGAYSVTNGEWLAVSISATLSGFDVNDTNNGVQIFQNNGNNPSTISQASQFSASSKIGLWAWIVGTVVSGNGPSSPGSTNCAGIIDCVIPNIVNSSCNFVTITCQTGGSIFWIIILTVITIGVLGYFFTQTMPGVNIGRIGLGEIAVLAFFGWMVAFNAAGVLASWVMIFMFFIVAWLFMGRLKGSGPI